MVLLESKKEIKEVDKKIFQKMPRTTRFWLKEREPVSLTKWKCFHAGKLGRPGRFYKLSCRYKTKSVFTFNPLCKKTGNSGTHEDALSRNGAPNIVMILVDDMGWGDFNSFTEGKGLIPTPNLDKLAASGLRLTSNYVQPSCTPSRASLMTGRYAHNTGLTFAIFGSSPAGLPSNIPIMPELLSKAGYSTHMVGKWHLGKYRWGQVPVGRGFQTHVGSLHGIVEYYTKNLWKYPSKWGGKDWGAYYQNKTYQHFQDPRHATVAQTEDAIMRMQEHVSGKENVNPLFLYVSYNAPHTPYQPMPEWKKKCRHIQHQWRRNHCAMVVGLDNEIPRVIKAAQRILGKNTVVVFSSDNGGYPWEGGLNAPLRGAKLTTFEGGIRVPGFVLDFSSHYASSKRDMKHMLHISDWLPTFLDWAGRKDLLSGLHIDGLSQSEALMDNQKVRDEMVIEMVDPDNSHEEVQSWAYRKGPYKILMGNIRDPNWYSEPTHDWLATSDTSELPLAFEKTLKLTSHIWGLGPTDSRPNRVLSMATLYRYHRYKLGNQTVVFDVEKDPQERTNLCRTDQRLCRRMERLLLEQRGKQQTDVEQQKYWYGARRPPPFVKGDCTAARNSRHMPTYEKYDYYKYTSCQFIHPI